MKNYILLFTFLFLLVNYSCAQNRDYVLSLVLGAGQSGVNNTTAGVDRVSRIFYPTGGIQLQTKLNKSWAINIYPGLSMSGNVRELSQPLFGISKADSKSAFLNLGIHGKYYTPSNVYFSFGPEISYLLWSFTRTFSGETLISNENQTEFLNRSGFHLSAAIGYSKPFGSKRKDTKLNFDPLWFIELRGRQSLTNLLPDSQTATRFSAIEIVTGISIGRMASSEL